MNYLIHRLNRFELTRRERQFIELTKGYFAEKGSLNDQQQVILEGLYNEKLRWARLGLIKEKSKANDQHKNGSGRFYHNSHPELKD